LLPTEAANTFSVTMPVDKVSLVQILALEGDEIHTDFAWGGKIEHEVCSPTKFRVENVEYSVPLSFKVLI
jgi:hypothetical protein